MTRVDVRGARSPDGALHDRGRAPATKLPSIVASQRVIGATNPPPNVIPFTKPRAIAAIAAANPHAVVTMAPSSAAMQPRPPAAPMLAPMLAPFETPIRIARGAATAATAAPAGPAAPTSMMTAPPATAAPAMPASHGVGAQVTAHQLATGWTPPQAVSVVAQPASPPAVARAASAASPPAVARAASAASPLSPVTAWPTAGGPAASAPVVTQRPAAQMAVAEPIAEPNARWATYEQLGLGAPPPAATPARSQRAANLIVNAYRLLGFGILTVIVIVLVGYIASTVFYYVSDSWIVPMAVSPTDEKVVSLQAQLAEQQHARDRIADELQQAERAIAAQQTFQAEFAKAIKSDLEARRLALGRVRALASAAAQTRASIKSQNSAYASAARRRIAEEYAAGLIDRSGMLSGKFQLAQITSSILTLAERQAEFETRAAELEAQTRSLDAILADASGGDAVLSYEVLRIKQEYEASRLDLARSIEARDTLRAALERQGKIVTALQRSAYLRAVQDQASVAFVPYGNLSNVAKGTSLYGCKLGMIFCGRVGEVLDVLPGEVQFKHPHRDKHLRGQLVVLKLAPDEAGAAAEDVLFAGGRPLLF